MCGEGEHKADDMTWVFSLATLEAERSLTRQAKPDGQQEIDVQGPPGLATRF